jgi:hypothetical protein
LFGNHTYLCAGYSWSLQNKVVAIAPLLLNKKPAFKPVISMLQKVAGRQAMYIAVQDASGLDVLAQSAGGADVLA